GVRGVRNSHANRIVHGIADGRTRRDRRRLADSDHATLGHVVHMNNNLWHVFDTAEFVKLHIGINLSAGDTVHDPLFEERVVDGHNYAAGNLRLAGQLIDDQAAILNGNDLGAAHHTGLGVNQDFSDLHAADTLIGEARRPVTLTFHAIHAEFGA